MPAYKFKALDEKGKLITDTVVASTEKEAESLLKDKKFKVLVLREQKEKRFSLLRFEKKIPPREKITLCRYLSAMINAGMSLGESFDLLINSSTNKRLKKILQDVSSSVRKGQSLLLSFSKYPEDFGEIFLAMIKVGEMSGTLTDSFDYLGKEYQQEENLRKKITSALLYPLIIVCLMIGVGILMMTFVLPRLGKVFLRLNLDLPLATRLLLQVSLFMEKNYFVVIIALILFAISSLFILRSKKGRAFFFFWGTKIPIIKKLLMEYSLIRFNQSLSSLMKVGVPIGESLEIASRALDPTNPERLSKIFGEKIAKGLPLSTVFMETKLFPPLMTQMLAVGERAGNLEKVLSDMSGFYQQEVEDSLKDLITLLEPTLMILVGIAVGVMIIAFISPIYSLIGKLQPG